MSIFDSMPWIEHDGSGCPLSPGEWFQVKHFDGVIRTLQMGDPVWLNAHPNASSWHWTIPQPHKIAFYKLIVEPDEAGEILSAMYGTSKKVLEDA